MMSGQRFLREGLTYWHQHSTELLLGLTQHIELTALALGIAILIALPAGIFLSKYRMLSDMVLALWGILYTIPGMALFALLVPLFGLGQQSALIAMVIYAQFVLLRNTVLAFRTIDERVIETGKGLGLTDWQLFRHIQLPYALPTLLGGLRIATVTLIALATLAAWINAGGLGQLLFQGLTENHPADIVWSALLISSLALWADRTLSGFEQHALRLTHITRI